MTSFSRLQIKVLAKFDDTACMFRNAGAAAGGAVKIFRAMETYNKKKIVTNYVCFCSSTMLTTKMITEL